MVTVAASGAGAGKKANTAANVQKETKMPWKNGNGPYTIVPHQWGNGKDYSDEASFKKFD